MATRFPNAYVMSVMSDDHPGIVAAVGGAVRGLSGNIDACSQTVLNGYFTLITVVSFPQPQAPDAISQAVRNADAAARDCQVMVKPFRPAAAPAREPVEKFVITAFGRDRPGVLLRFAQYLAGKDINIIDLYGDRQGEDFVLLSQVEVPHRWDIGMLQADLEHIGRDEGFTVRLQHENVFVATNQLRLSK